MSLNLIGVGFQITFCARAYAIRTSALIIVSSGGKFRLVSIDAVTSTYCVPVLKRHVIHWMDQACSFRLQALFAGH